MFEVAGVRPASTVNARSGREVQTSLGITRRAPRRHGGTPARARPHRRSDIELGSDTSTTAETPALRGRRVSPSGSKDTGWSHEADAVINKRLADLVGGNRTEVADQVAALNEQQ